MGNFESLKTAIAEVIKQNGNEEITGDVLQFILLEMVSGLGAGYRFLGTCTPSTEPLEPDGAAFYVGASGEYRNFTGITPTVPNGSICFFKWDGSGWSYSTLTVTNPVDAEIVEDAQNPVCGGAIFDEFKKLRDAGYLFAGVAVPSTEPAQDLTEKVFYLATQAGSYSYFGNGLTLTWGLNIIRFNGTVWQQESIEGITDQITEGNTALVTAGGVFAGLKELKEEISQLLEEKQDVLTIDTAPVEDSDNPISSGAVFDVVASVMQAIENIDLSSFVTIDDVNSALVSALNDYYTKSETDAIIDETKGELADVKLSISKDVVKVGESTAVTINVESNVSADELILKRNDVQIAQGSGKVLQYTDTVTEDQNGEVVYTVELKKGEAGVTAEALLQVVNPVYYGAGLSVSGITTQATARKTPAGRYEFTAQDDESNIFILVPMGMAVNFITMGGIEVPMALPTGMFIGSVQYLCYQSSNTYDAGDYVINVY